MNLSTVIFHKNQYQLPENNCKKSDKVATHLKARGYLIGLGFDWFNFIRDWIQFGFG